MTVQYLNALSNIRFSAPSFRPVCVSGCRDLPSHPSGGENPRANPRRKRAYVSKIRNRPIGLTQAYVAHRNPARPKRITLAMAARVFRVPLAIIEAVWPRIPFDAQGNLVLCEAAANGAGQPLSRSGAPLHKLFAAVLRVSEEFQNWEPETDGIPKSYSPQQIAQAWNLSAEFIRLLFMNEPGVLRFNKTGKSSKKARQYTTIRIPKPVMLRVYKKWQKLTRAQ